MKKTTSHETIAGIIFYTILLLMVFLPSLHNNNKTETYTAEEVRNKTSAYNEPIIEAREESVFVTDTGAKYHEYGCRYLHSSCIEITFEKANERGYKPCRICNQ